MAEIASGSRNEDELCSWLEGLVSSGKVSDPGSLASRLTKLAASCRALERKRTSSSIDVVGTELLITIPDVSSMSPRGKVSASIGKGGMALSTKSDDVLVAFPWSQVVEVLAAPSCETQSVESQSSAAYLIVVLDQKLKKERFRCVALSVKKKEGKVSPGDDFFRELGVDPRPKNNEFSTSSMLGLAVTKLSKKPLRRLVRGEDPSFFLTSVTGAPFVKATLGTSTGHLALTRAGLLFLKPPVFLPTHAIASIQIGRAGGVSHSSASFFDLIVQLSEDLDQDQQSETSRPSLEYEFSNIAKDELGRLQHFVSEVVLQKEARGQEAAVVAVKQEPGGQIAEDSDDDDDEEDDDFDPNADDEDDEDDDDDEEEEDPGSGAAEEEEDEGGRSCQGEETESEDEERKAKILRRV